MNKNRNNNSTKKKKENNNISIVFLCIEGKENNSYTYFCSFNFVSYCNNCPIKFKFGETIDRFLLTNS